MLYPGSDYTASFFIKGKVKVYECVEASEELQELFCNYGDYLGLPPSDLRENYTKTLEALVDRGTGYLHT